MITGPPLSGTFATLIEAVIDQASRRPSRDAVSFLPDGIEVAERLTFSESASAMERIAAGLAARALRGRPTLLALPPGIGFVQAMLGCLRAGALAVPIPWPALGDAALRVRAIAAQVGAAGVIFAADDPRAVRDGFFDGLPPHRLEDLLSTNTRDMPPIPRPADPALIQYSSGSTRQPRGIVVTHGNLAANEAMIQALFGTTEDDLGVNWLPPSHDMGLVGAVLHAYHTGATAMLMPPQLFLQRPLRWLQAISRHGATVAGGPNFAFDLCVRRISVIAVEELDLSRWRVAFCGAEPIRAATLKRFAARFAPAGFKAEAFLPCYGLAEATLAATGGHLAEPVSALLDTAPVSCGAPAPGCALMLRADDALPAGSGEICLAGPHITAGTWDGASGTVRPFAELVSGADGTRFLRTGDAGRIAGGALLVLDRLKDVLVVHGRKIHAIDIEAAALDAWPTMAAAAAFALPAIDTAPERPILLCELPVADLAKAGAPERETILREVSARTGIAPYVTFLRFGALPRTTSGKIRRHAAREAFAAGAWAEARPT